MFYNEKIKKKKNIRNVNLVKRFHFLARPSKRFVPIQVLASSNNVLEIKVLIKKGKYPDLLTDSLFYRILHNKLLRDFDM